jgi:acetyl-CoA carboxylase biotin carboxyl carrier protein
MDLSNDDVAEILALLDSLPYDELDVQTPRFRLTLRRTPGGGWTEEQQVLTTPAVADPAPRTPAAGAPAPGTKSGAPLPAAASGAGAGTAGPGSAGPGSAGPAAPDRAAEADEDGPEAGGDGFVAVTAPLPGTFYRAPRPGADPFVREGDAVSPDTVVAIVETMKLMNSVHAGTAGRVASICAASGEFTPLGTTLLLIEPDA